MGVRAVARRSGVAALALFVLVATSAVQARADATGRAVLDSTTHTMSSQ